MDLNRLTQKSQEALHDAQTKALRFGHTEVDGEHLLLALLDQPEGLVAAAARAGGRRPGPAPRGARGRAVPAARGSAVRAPRPDRCSSPSGSPGCSTRAEREAKRLKDEYVSVEHLVHRPARRGLGHRRPAGCCASRG